MTGHRRAMNWRLVIVPPPGDCWVVVERERRVAGQVFFKNGHRPLDWRRSASMMLAYMEDASELGDCSYRGRARWEKKPRKATLIDIRKEHALMMARLSTGSRSGQS